MRQSNRIYSARIQRTTSPILCLMLLALAVWSTPSSHAFSPTNQTPLKFHTKQHSHSRNTQQSNHVKLSISTSHLQRPPLRNHPIHSQSTSLKSSRQDEYPIEPQVYPQRWTQLAYLSLLALLSDWICFSLAASPSSFAAAYPNSSAADLIDIFLFTNVSFKSLIVF